MDHNLSNDNTTMGRTPQACLSFLSFIKWKVYYQASASYMYIAMIITSFITSNLEVNMAQKLINEHDSTINHQSCST